MCTVHAWYNYKNLQKIAAPIFKLVMVSASDQFLCMGDMISLTVGYLAQNWYGEASNTLEKGAWILLHEFGGYPQTLPLTNYRISLNFPRPWILPAAQLSSWAWLNVQLFDCTSSTSISSKTRWNCYLWSFNYI